MKQQELLEGVENTRQERRPLDFYQTPRWMTQALLRRIDFHLPFVHVLEPTAGDLAIVRVLQQVGVTHITTNDIDRARPTGRHRDATLKASWSDWFPHVVLTNPPFDVTFPILQHAFEHTSDLIAILQRETFDEPTIERGPWFKLHRPTLKLVMPRWNFRTVDGKGGNDNVPPCWFMWVKEDARGFAYLRERGTDYVTRAEREELRAADRLQPR